MREFDHDRLDVYRVAIDFIAVADEVVDGLPRGRAYLADQLQRAATSIVLNIAEGAGEFSPGDKVRFYRMARRSANECAAVLDVVRVRDLGEPARLQAGRDLLLRIVSMLVRMARTASESGTGTGTGTKIAEAAYPYESCASSETAHEFSG